MLIIVTNNQDEILGMEKSSKGGQSLEASFIMCSRNISITNQSCVPFINGYKSTLNTNSPINIQIKELWFLNTKFWDKEIVRSIFVEQEVDLVLEIMVYQHNEEKLLWILESQDHFIIRSTFHARNAYHFNLDEVKVW